MKSFSFEMENDICRTVEVTHFGRQLKIVTRFSDMVERARVEHDFRIIGEPTFHASEKFVAVTFRRNVFARWQWPWFEYTRYF